ncbi:2-hydroxymuconic semialdehyde dehydrogenase [Neisseriaceae bacterium CLB008]
MDTSVLPLYINGEFIRKAPQFDNTSPVNGRLVNRVTYADREAVDLAVAAAREALDGPWGLMTPEQRSALLHRLANAIEARFEEFVAAEVQDTGRPLSVARRLDIPRAIANFRTFADLSKTNSSSSCITYNDDGSQLINYTVRKPLGVIAVISPWNLPLLLLTWKLGPALAMGNTVVCKPSEESPSSASLLAEVMHEVGIPKGVFNLIQGYGREGEFLTQNPDIDAVSFTGESRTGAAIMKTVADGVKEISFELGGKNAAVVFADADFEQAVAGVARSSFFNTGQVCMCTERVYVHRSIFDRFVAALKVKAEALVLGGPDESGTDVGPLISRKHQEKVCSYFQLALDEGATVVTGNRVPDFQDDKANGAFVLPTIWTGLDDAARINQEEIFGPVCHVAPFDDDAEVIKRVNDSRYGLVCSLWTSDVTRAHRLAGQVHTGIVWINTWFARDLRTPFGGVKASGIGREGGQYSLDFFSEITNISVKY